METGMIHQLKIWPEYFEAVQRGSKRFEIRKNDRDYQVGDILILSCFDPDTNSYIREDDGAFIKTIAAYITYIAQGVFGLPEDIAVMSIEPVGVEPRCIEAIENEEKSGISES